MRRLTLLPFLLPPTYLQEGSAFVTLWRTHVCKTLPTCCPHFDLYVCLSSVFCVFSCLSQSLSLCIDNHVSVDVLRAACQYGSGWYNSLVVFSFLV